MREAIDTTGIREALDASAELPSLGNDDATQMASLDDDYGDDTDVGIDTSLLDATGQTQILTEDMAVDTAANLSDTAATLLAPGDDDDTGVYISDDAATLMAPLDDDGDFDFAKTEALPKDVFSPDMSTDDTGRLPGLAGSTDVDLDLDDLTAALKVSEVGDTVNQVRDDATVEQPRLRPGQTDRNAETGMTQSLAPEDMSADLHDARTMTEVGTKLDLARAYVDMGDPGGARSILEEVLDEGDEAQRQQAKQLIDTLPT
jgi:pilus assembly protein FimV